MTLPPPADATRIKQNSQVRVLNIMYVTLHDKRMENVILMYKKKTYRTYVKKNCRTSTRKNHKETKRNRERSQYDDRDVLKQQ